MSLSPGRVRALKLFLVAAPLLLALAAAEIYTRFFSPYGYTTPGLRKERSLRYVPTIFARHALARGPATARWSSGPEYRINEHGYRGPFFSTTKPEGTVRVMIYGGSAVFDLHAGPEEAWPRQVEANLRAEGHGSVEVINAGVPGHATFDSLGRLFAEGHTFGPDYVLLYHAWNDLKYFRSDEPLLRTIRPHDPTADPRMNYRNRLDRWLCNSSQVYVRLRARYYNRKLGAGSEGAWEEGAYATRLSETAIRQYRLGVEAFVDTARNAGTVPILVTQARLVRADNDDEERSRIAYHYPRLEHDTLVEAFEQTDSILRDVALAKRVALIDAGAAIARSTELFEDHVHLTPEGSAAVAEVVARGLASIL